ncbi:putative ankyrin repeat protein [Acanthamoeba polyphaga mimivirus]|uniref:Ankyrin repeat protein n=1 Tax=Acanthamoeba polyphaga mimivirus Kroon TaxID=3069720 RepID=A0A0G2Y5A7_9VIRU|nr:putative ankyrin repeat protein [Acanthamoeba polyphaga mimivirus]AKI79749.1 putative ankyrin repeat protein [Acanthamoeba polyphaga mimivirus Kroon]
MDEIHNPNKLLSIKNYKNNIIIIGSINPNSDDIYNGEIYINSSTCEIYCKINALWFLVDVIDHKIFIDTGPPPLHLGEIGDYYINCKNNNLYVKTSSLGDCNQIFVLQTNIRGNWGEIDKDHYLSIHNINIHVPSNKNTSIDYDTMNIVDPSITMDNFIVYLIKNNLFDTFKYLIDFEPKKILNINLNNCLNFCCSCGALNFVEKIILFENDYNYEKALMIAADNNHFNIVQFLINTGANYHIDNEYVLHMACKNGNIDIIRQLIDLGSDISALDYYAIKIACQNGHENIVRYFINLNIIPQKHLVETAEIAALNNHDNISKYMLLDNIILSDDIRYIIDNFVCNKNLEMLKFMMENNLLLDYIDDIFYFTAEYGHINIMEYLMSICKDKKIYDNAVRKAIKLKNMDIVFILLENGASFDEECYYDTAIIYAAEYGNLGWIKLLQFQSANIRYSHDYALRIAAKYGNLTVVEYLIDQGCNVKSNNNDSLCWATHNGHFEVVRYLIEKGADITDRNGEIIMWALMYDNLDIYKFYEEIGFDASVDYENYLIAGIYSGNLDVVKHLIENKKNNILIKTIEPLIVAVKIGYLDIICYLFDKYYNNKIQFFQINELLEFAANFGHLDIVIYLISKKANPRINNDNPLKFATREGHLNVVQYLIDNVNYVKADFNEPIILACIAGYLDIVRYLVEKGADINARFKDKSAIEYADYYLNYDIVEYLKSHIKYNNINYNHY